MLENAKTQEKLHTKPSNADAASLTHQLDILGVSQLISRAWSVDVAHWLCRALSHQTHQTEATLLNFNEMSYLTPLL